MAERRSMGLKEEDIISAISQAFGGVKEASKDVATFKVKSQGVDKLISEFQDLTDAVERYNNMASSKKNTSGIAKYYGSEEKMISNLKLAWNEYVKDVTSGVADMNNLKDSKSAKAVLRNANALEALYGRQSYSGISSELTDLVDNMRSMTNFSEGNYNMDIAHFRDVLSVVKEISDLMNQYSFDNASRQSIFEAMNLGDIEKAPAIVNQLLSIGDAIRSTKEEMNSGTNSGDGFVEETEEETDRVEKAAKRQEKALEDLNQIRNRAISSKKKTYTFYDDDDFYEEMYSRENSSNKFGTSRWVSISGDSIQDYQEALQELKTLQEESLRAAQEYQHEYAEAYNRGDDIEANSLLSNMEEELQYYNKFGDAIDYVQQRLNDTMMNFKPGDNWGLDEIQTLIALLQDLAKNIKDISTAIGNVDDQSGFSSLLSQLQDFSSKIDDAFNVDNIQAFEQSLRDIVETLSMISLSIGVIGDGGSKRSKADSMSIRERLLAMQNKIGKTSFNVNLREDNTLDVQQRIKAEEDEWRRQAQRYTDAYDEIFKIYKSYDIGNTPDNFLVALQQGSESFRINTSGIDIFKEFSRYNIIENIKDPIERIQSIMDFMTNVKKATEELLKGDLFHQFGEQFKKSDFWKGENFDSEFQSWIDNNNKIVDDFLKDNPYYGVYKYLNGQTRKKAPATNMGYLNSKIRNLYDITGSHKDKKSLKEETFDFLGNLLGTSGGEEGAAQVSNENKEIQTLIDSFTQLQSVIKTGLGVEELDDGKFTSFLDTLVKKMEEVATAATNMAEAISNIPQDVNQAQEQGALSQKTQEELNNGTYNVPIGMNTETSTVVQDVKNALDQVNFEVTIKGKLDSAKQDSDISQGPISSGTTALPEQEQAAGQAGQQMGEQIADGANTANEAVEKLAQNLSELFARLQNSPNEITAMFGKDGIVAEATSNHPSHVSPHDKYPATLSNLNNGIYGYIHNHPAGNPFLSAEDISDVLTNSGTWENGDRLSGVIADQVVRFLDLNGVEKEVAQAFVREYKQSGLELREKITQQLSGVSFKEFQNKHLNNDKIPDDMFKKFEEMYNSEFEQVQNGLLKKYGIENKMHVFNPSQTQDIAKFLLDVQERANTAIEPVQKLINLVEFGAEKKLDLGSEEIQNILNAFKSGDLSAIQAFDKLMVNLGSDFHSLSLDDELNKFRTSFKELFGQDFYQNNFDTIQEQLEDQIFDQAKTAEEMMTKARELFKDKLSNETPVPSGNAQILSPDNIGEFNASQLSEYINKLDLAKVSLEELQKIASRATELGGLEELNLPTDKVNEFTNKLDELSNAEKNVGAGQEDIVGSANATATAVSGATKEISGEGDAAAIAATLKEKFAEANKHVAESANATADATEKATKNIEDKAAATQNATEANENAKKKQDEGIYLNQTDYANGDYSYAKYLGFAQKEMVRIGHDDDGNEVVASDTISTNFRKIENEVIRTDKIIMKLYDDLENGLSLGKPTEAITQMLDIFLERSRGLTEELDKYYREAGYLPGDEHVQDFMNRRMEASMLTMSEIQNANDLKMDSDWRAAIAENRRRDAAEQRRIQAEQARQEAEYNRDLDASARRYDVLSMRKARETNLRPDEEVELTNLEQFRRLLEIAREYLQLTEQEDEAYQRMAQSQINADNERLRLQEELRLAQEEDLREQAQSQRQQEQLQRQQEQRQQQEADNGFTRARQTQDKRAMEEAKEINRMQQAQWEANQRQQQEADKASRDATLLNAQKDVRLSQLSNIQTQLENDGKLTEELTNRINNLMNELSNVPDKDALILFDEHLKLLKEDIKSVGDTWDGALKKINEQQAKIVNKDFLDALHNLPGVKKQADVFKDSHDSKGNWTGALAQEIQDDSSSTGYVTRYDAIIQKQKELLRSSQELNNLMKQQFSSDNPDAYNEDINRIKDTISRLKGEIRDLANVDFMNNLTDQEFSSIDELEKRLDAIERKKQEILNKQYQRTQRDDVASYRQDLNEYKGLYKKSVEAERGVGVFSPEEAQRMNDLLISLTEQQKKWVQEIQNGDEYLKKITGSLKTVKDVQDDVSGNKKYKEIFNLDQGSKDIESEIRKFESINVDNVFGSKFDAKMQEINDAFANITQRIADLKGKEIDLVTNQEIEDVKTLERELKKIVSDAQKSPDFTLAKGASRSGLQAKAQKWLDKNTAAIPSARAEVSQLYNELSSDVPVSRLAEIKDRLNQIEAEMIRTGHAGKSFGDTLRGSFDNLLRYFLSFASIYRIIGTFKQVVSNVKELDSALTEMRKVSDESISTLKQFQQESFAMADSIGTTALQVQKSTADWMRLGETLEEAKESAKDSTILLNVSEFTSIDDATQSLVSMSQAYKELDKIDIIDKLNNIGNNFSISTDQLAQGLQNAAAVLKTQGNDIDEAIALLTAGNALPENTVMYLLECI